MSKRFCKDGKIIPLKACGDMDVIDYGKVSIIVPVYNVENELDRCIESLLEQTYKNIEIILIDDGSPDNCPRMCEWYLEKDNRIKVLHKENGGLSSARNKGLDISSGEYIAFVDSDDWVESDFIETLINNLCRENADISIIGYTMVWDSGITRRFSNDEQYFVFDKNRAIKELLMQQKYQCMVCQKLYRSNIFETIRFPEGKIYEDVAVGLPTFLLCNKVVFSGKSKYFYYQRSNSIVNSDFNEKKLYLLKCCQDIIAFSNANNGLFAKEAHAFYLRALMMLQLQLYGAGYNKNKRKLRKKILTEIKNHKKYIWGNKSLEIKKKIVLTLMIFHFPSGLLHKVWNKKRTGN